MKTLDALKKQSDSEKLTYLEHVLEHAPDAYFMIDREGRILDANIKATTSLGYSKEELKDMTIMDIEKSIPNKQAYLAVQQRLRNQTNKIAYGEQVRKNGSTFPVEVHVSVIKNGRKDVIIACARNISNRKKLQNKIKESHDFLRLYLDHFPGEVFIQDETGAHRIAHDFIKEASSLIQKNTIPKQTENLYQQKEKKDIIEDLKVVDSESCVFHDESQRYFLTRKFPVPNEDGDVLIGGVAIDITEFKKAQIELEEKKQKLAHINDDYKNLNQELKQRNRELKEAKLIAELNEFRLNEAQRLAKMGSWEHDLIQKRLFWSDEIYTIFNVEKGMIDVTYERFLSFVHPDDKDMVNWAYKQHITNRDPYDIVHRLLLENKEVKYVHERCETTFDEDGNPTRSIGTVVDVTENILLQNELREAKQKAEESDKLKTEFLHNMSHEVRTPMNGIIGFSQLLETPSIKQKDRQTYTRVIRDCSNQLLRIIENILEISNLGARQVQVEYSLFNLNDLIEELYRDYLLTAQKNNIELRISKPLKDDWNCIFNDRSKIKKILTHLMDNSLRFTRKGFVEIGFKFLKDRVNIYVKDSGVGIEKSRQKHIFEKFSQGQKDLAKKSGGLGLGLAIAKENAMLLGGNIEFDSQTGEGSNFVLTLPVNELPEDISENSQGIIKRVSKQDSTYKVVVAEDEDVNFLYIEALMRALSKINVQLVRAKNGKEAVDICKTDEMVDLVLMDIKMPIMDGIEATKIIKENHPELPIVAQTAYTSDYDRKKAISAGCVDFITKPIDIKTLFSTIFKHLEVL